MHLSLLNDKLTVTMPYNPTHASRIRMVPGVRWSVVSKKWTIPKDVATLDQFRRLFPWATIGGDVKVWEMAFKHQAAWNIENKKNFDIMDNDWSAMEFKLKPYAHQLKALDLCYTNKTYALAKEMGCGKSAVIIHLLRKLKTDGYDKPSLIICPLSVVGVWEQEIKKQAGDELTCIKLTGDKHERIRKIKTEADIYIINYEGLRILSNDLEGRDWLAVVCDESQRIKNRTTQQSKLAFRISRKADRRYILSGTLISNNPLDAFGQFKFLNEEILGTNYFGFANRYAFFVTNGRARFPVKFINLEELANRIDPWTFRVTKKECLDLPDKIYETRYVPLSAKAEKIYKDLSNELVAFLESGEVVTAQIILTKLLRFSQLTSGFVMTEKGEIVEVEHEGKVNEVEDIVKEAEGQVVIWTKFKHEMVMVVRRLDRLGIKYGCIEGATPQKKREEVLARFANNELKVFVSQIQAGGLGINLNTANTCIYYSNPYSLGDRLQSEDRLHRIGQHNNVTYYDLICPGTIDEKVLEILRSKKNLADVINKDVDRKKFAKEVIGVV